MLRISELRNKDVIDLQEGKRIGYIDDIDLDLERGRIESLVIPTSNSRMFNLFGRGEDIVIHWRQIKKIGVDVILIDPDSTVHIEPIAAEEPQTQQPQIYTPPVNPFTEDPFEDQDDLFEL